MVNNDGFDFQFIVPGKLFQAIATMLAGLMGSIIVMFLGGVRLANSRLIRRIALQDTQDTRSGFTATVYQPSLIGRQGRAYTILRPSGKVEIDGDIYDAYTRGEYIRQGDKIEVISNEVTSLKVKKID